MRYLGANPQPSYLRLGKVGEQNIHPQVPDLAPGRWLPIRVGDESGATLLSTGAALPLALQMCELEEFSGHSVHSLPLWGMKTKLSQPAQAARWKAIVTLEDHLTDGGFGSWVRESLGESGIRVACKALDSRVCGLVGKQESLNRIGGLGL